VSKRNWEFATETGRFAGAKANVNAHHFVIIGAHEQAEADIVAKMVKGDVRGKKGHFS
jgi:hypothetical protein